MVTGIVGHTRDEHGRCGLGCWVWSRGAPGPSTRPAHRTGRGVHCRDPCGATGPVPRLRRRHPRRTPESRHRARRLPRPCCSADGSSTRSTTGCSRTRRATADALEIRFTASAARCRLALSTSHPGRSAASTPSWRPGTRTTRSPSPGTSTRSCAPCTTPVPSRVAGSPPAGSGRQGAASAYEEATCGRSCRCCLFRWLMGEGPRAPRR